MSLGFGAQWGRQVDLLADLRVRVRELLAVGMGSELGADVEAGWKTRIVPITDLDSAERYELLAQALSSGWQPTDDRQRQIVIDAGLADALLTRDDLAAWNPPSLGRAPLPTLPDSEDP